MTVPKVTFMTGTVLKLIVMSVTVLKVTVVAVKALTVTVTVMIVIVLTVTVTVTVTGYVGSKVIFPVFQIACSMLIKLFHHPGTQPMVKVGPVWYLNCTDGETFRYLSSHLN